MKKKLFVVVLLVTGLAIVAFIITRQNQNQTRAGKPKSVKDSIATPQSRSSSSAKLIPAYYETAPSLSSLAPTLQPEQFKGKAREAYQAVGMIPQTIAQMPC